MIRLGLSLSTEQANVRSDTLLREPMLQLRSAQLALLDERAQAEFANRLSSYVREKHGEVEVRFPNAAAAVSTLSSAVLQRLIRNGIGRAQQYGLTSQSSIAAYVVLMFVASPNFDRHEAVRGVLLDDSIEPGRRMSEICRRVGREDWSAARQAYDPADWQPRAYAA